VKTKKNKNYEAYGKKLWCLDYSWLSSLKCYVSKFFGLKKENGYSWVQGNN